MRQAVIFDLGGVLIHIDGAFKHNLDDLIEIDQAGLAFAKKSKEQGMRLLILSHCGKDSLHKMRYQYPELFSLFHEQDIFIPDTLGLRKPELACYERVVELAGLDLATTLFIDDSLVNVQGARECGISSVLHIEWKQTEHEVQKLLNKQLDSDGGIALKF